MRQQAQQEQREQAAEIRAQRAAEKERKEKQVSAGKAKAEVLNAQNARTLDRLESILREGLDRRARVDPDELLRRDRLPPLDLGSSAEPAPPPEWSTFSPEPPGAVARLLGGQVRYERRLEEARAAFEQARTEHDQAEAARRHGVDGVQAQRADRERAHQAEVAEHNRRIADMADGLARRDRESVQAYLELALSRTPLPDDLPRTVEIAYSPRGEQAVVRVELPSLDVVPDIAAYTYIATTNTMREKPMPANRRHELYRSVISQVMLLYLRDLLEADPDLDNVELGGHVHAIDPATGHREYRCLISVAVDRTTYARLNLRDVTPAACLQRLNALVSRHPHLVDPVRPIRDFDLARYSFVEAVDVVADLDSRPDLTKMTPTEFEHFVRQLFEARGLEGWTTERTGDDGVDAVVINRDPLIGGLTIVQAKKYTRVLGVNHIRELVGAMDEKRAGRGVLVTTSWFASGCWTKASENGRVELIDGPRLRHLCRDHLQLDVLVAPPTGKAHVWQPPQDP
ncbi:MAG: restriction endonuclease [Dehalococcoidia bacterium]